VATFCSDGDIGLCLDLLELSVHVLQVLERSAGVEALGASERAETDLVALSELHVATKHLQALVGVLIARVNNPSVGLHEHSWPKVILRVPPIAGAGRLAAGAEHALVKTVEELSLLHRLQILLDLQVSGHLLTLQEGLDGLVLRVEVRHVNDQILQHEHEHQGRDHGLVVVLGHGGEAGQVVAAVNVHGAGAADALAARAAEGEGGVDLVLDLDEGVEDHGTALVHVNVVSHVLGLILWVVGVRSVDIEALEFALLSLSQALLVFLSVVRLHDIADIAEAGRRLARENSNLGRWVVQSFSSKRLLRCGLN